MDIDWSLDDDFSTLCEALDTRISPTHSLKELRKRLKSVCAVLQQLSLQSAEMRTSMTNLNNDTMRAETWGSWSDVVDVLALRPDEAENSSLYRQRWDIILHGWLPAFRALCLVLESLSRVSGNDPAVRSGSKPPADLLSLQIMSIIHAGLELLVCWGISPRLDPDHRLGLSALRQPSIILQRTSLSSSNKSSAASMAPAVTTHCRSLSAPVIRALTPQALRDGSSGGTKKAVEDLLGAPYDPQQQHCRELPGVRRLRLLCIVIIMNRVFCIPQVRLLLTPRYFQDLVSACLELALNHTEPESMEELWVKRDYKRSRTVRDWGTWALSSVLCAHEDSEGKSVKSNGVNECAAGWLEFPPSQWRRRDAISPLLSVDRETMVSTFRNLARLAGTHRKAVLALRANPTTSIDRQLPTDSVLKTTERLVGDFLSRLLCCPGGLEAFLHSFLSPLSERGSDVAESGCVAALEQLVVQLARIPEHLRQSVAQPQTLQNGDSTNVAESWKSASAYMMLILPQLLCLIPRALFVYRLESEEDQSAKRTAPKKLRPPPGSLDGVTAYVVMRLVGALADVSDTVASGHSASMNGGLAAAAELRNGLNKLMPLASSSGDAASSINENRPSWWHVRRHLLAPLVGPLVISPAEKDEHEFSAAITVLHGLTVLVPPTPGLLHALKKNPANLKTIPEEDESNAIFKLETRGILPSLIQLLAERSYKEHQKCKSAQTAFIQELGNENEECSERLSSLTSFSKVGTQLQVIEVIATSLLKRANPRDAAVQLRDAARYVIMKDPIQDSIVAMGPERISAVMDIILRLMGQIDAARQSHTDTTTHKRSDASTMENLEDNVSVTISLFELLFAQYIKDGDSREHDQSADCPLDDGGVIVEQERYIDLSLLVILIEQTDPISLFGTSDGGYGALSMLRTLLRLIIHLQRKLAVANSEATANDSARNHMLGVVTGRTDVNKDGTDTHSIDISGTLSRDDRKLMANILLRNEKNTYENFENHTVDPQHDVFVMTSLTLSLFETALLLASSSPPLSTNEADSSSVNSSRQGIVGLRESLLDNMVVPVARLAATLSETAGGVDKMLNKVQDSTMLPFLHPSSAIDMSSTVKAALIIDDQGEASAHERSVNDTENNEIAQVDDWKLLAEKCQEVHLLLLRRKQKTVKDASSRLTDYLDETENMTHHTPLDMCVQKIFRHYIAVGTVNALQDDTGLLSSEAYLRAQAVYNLTKAIKEASATADKALTEQAVSHTNNHTEMIQEVFDHSDEAPESTMCFSDATLGLILGVLLGMLCDEESYVYLGAVQAFRELLSMAGGGPGSANRRWHFHVITSVFAQAPLVDGTRAVQTRINDCVDVNVDDIEERRHARQVKRLEEVNGAHVSASDIAKHARMAMIPLLQHHLARRERISLNLEGAMKLHRDAETAALKQTILQLKKMEAFDKNSAAKFVTPERNIVPLTFSQRLPLGEALVLAVRWAGSAAPQYAPILLPALVRGARPPATPQESYATSSSEGNATTVESLALSALRASCFSGLAELSTHMGWAVHRYAADLSDLCRGVLLHERGDICGSQSTLKPMQLSPLQFETASKRNRTAVRRGAAFLARQLVESAAKRKESIIILPTSKSRRHSDGSNIVDLVGGITSTHTSALQGPRQKEREQSAITATADGNTSWLRELCVTLRDIDSGPKAARSFAKGQGEVNRPVEWSIETDSVVQFHARAALLCVDDSATGFTYLSSSNQ